MTVADGARVVQRASDQRRSRAVLAAIGAIAGLASGLFGVGGGFLIVPLQLLWTRTDARKATGTSLVGLIPIALVGAAGYYFGRIPGEVDVRVALSLVVGSVLGAYVGARLTGRLPERALGLVVVAMLFLVGIDEILRGLVPGLVRSASHINPGPLIGLQYAFLVGSGLLIGSVSAIVGVGGGIFFVPAMVIGVGLGQHLAQGTSLVAILPTATVGAIAHYRRGHVDLGRAMWIGLAGVPMSIVGTALALSLPPQILALGFGGILVFSAGRILQTQRRRVIGAEAALADGQPS